MLIKIMSLINKNIIVFFVCTCDNQGVHLPHFDENSDKEAGDDTYNKQS